MTASSSETTKTSHALLAHQSWSRVFCYALFIFSAFSMAGMELAVIMLMILGLIDLWRSGPPTDLPRWVVWSFPALIAIAVLASFLGEDTLSSLREIKSEYRIFLPLLMLPAFVAVDLRRLLKVYAVVVVVVAVYTFLQFGWNIHHKSLDQFWTLITRAPKWKFYGRGGFTNYLTLGGVMLMPACVFAGLWLKDHSSNRRWWLLGMMATGWIVLVSQARSSWVGLAVGGLVLVLILPRRWALPIIAGILASFTLLAYLLFTGWFWETFKDRVDNPLIIRFIHTTAERDDDRLMLWQAALRGIAAAPILGHGAADAPFDRYREAIAVEKGIIFDMVNLRAHNTILRIGFSFGLVGLAIFLWMWFGVVAWCVRGIRRIPDEDPSGGNISNSDHSNNDHPDSGYSNSGYSNNPGFQAGLLWGIAAALVGSLAQGWFGNHFFDGEINAAIMMWMGLGLHVGRRVLIDRTRLSKMVRAERG